MPKIDSQPAPEPVMRTQECSNCLLTSHVGESFCSNCGTRLSLRPPTVGERHLSKNAKVLLVIAVFFGFAALGKLSPHQKPEISELAAGRAVDTGSAVDRFRTRIMVSPGAASMFTSIQGGNAGVLRIKVSNDWFNSSPRQRRQVTQLIADIWQQEMGKERAPVEIYDFLDNEIAGTNFLRGVWIDDE